MRSSRTVPSRTSPTSCRLRFQMAGKSHLVTSIPEAAVYAGYLVRTRCSDSILPQYAKVFLESDFYWQQLRAGIVATAQPNFNGEKLSSMLLPLPPLTEQKRIVTKIEMLMPLVEEYGKMEETRLQLDADLLPRLRSRFCKKRYRPYASNAQRNCCAAQTSRSRR